MDNMTKDLDVFEAKLSSTLRASGHLFPMTDREMDSFLAHSDSVTLPEKYQTHDFVFKDDPGILVKTTHIEAVDFSGTAKSWALAARNGKDLPQSILEKMKEDKKNSQK